MRIISFLLTALIFCFLSAEAQIEKLNPNSSKECSICHYEWMPEFFFDLKGTPLVEFQKDRVVATEKMCFSCHNGTVGDSRIKIWAGDAHKLAQIPAHMDVPKNLPLTDGKIDCRTCHSAHSTGSPEEEGVEKSVFLRMDNENSELCKACHTDIGSSKMGMTHPLTAVKENKKQIEDRIHKQDGKLGKNGEVICQSCHTPHSPQEEKLLINYRNHSELCATCHLDKVSDKDAEYLKGMLNHPINITQDNQTIIDKIKLEGGSYGLGNEVICLTCHSVHKAKTETLLLRKNSDNSLCFVCHEKQKTVLGSKHDMKTVKGFVTKDGKNAHQKGTCESCHDPHGWSLELPKTDDDMITKGCLSCHQELGIASKMVISTKMFNHPVGKDITTDMHVYEKLPLFGEVREFFTEIGDDDTKRTMVTCATCHDVHSKDKDFLRVEAINGALCIVCHENKKVIENTPHGQEKLKKGCLDCHKVHNSTNKELLIKKEDDGCLECHKPNGLGEKKLIGAHSHPVNMKTKGKVDENFKLLDGEFTCSTCHDPHIPSKKGDVKIDFLRGNFTNYDSFCVACHEGFNQVAGTDHDLRDKQTANESVCSQCHSVHKAQTSENIMKLEYSYKTEDDFCKVCHTEKGLASKKTVDGGHYLGKVEAHEKYGKFLTEKDGDYYLYCSGCHNVHQNGPKKGEEGTFQNSFLKKELTENGNFCQSCHADKKEFADSKHNFTNVNTHIAEYVKAKEEGNTCGVCHITHNSGYLMFEKSLGSNFETICKNCHAGGKVAEKTAISTSHAMDIKPKTDIKIYLQDGKIVCATCHDSHGSMKDMLRDTGNSNMCLACHADQEKVVYSKHNLAQIDYMSEKVKEVAKDNACYVCHMPHNFHKDNKLMWAFEHKKKGDFSVEMCTDCHEKDGYGYKKIPEAINHDKIFKIFPFKENVKEFLYDENGKQSADGAISCQTCHDAHVWKPGYSEPSFKDEATLNDSFLRVDVKEKFCELCHGDQTNELYSKYHDKEFRELRNKQHGEMEVLRNLFMIQQNLQRLQEK